MYLNPTFLLIISLTFVFAPSIQEWVLSGNDTWYRPYFVWMAFIAFVYLTQRGKSRDEF